MNTPIIDFVKNYTDKNMSRFHMPGHKGQSLIGVESLDITEIEGADVLSTASGIIAESEENASSLFGTGHSFYVTQGSSTAICAMLALAAKPGDTVLAARNVHKAFVHGCALLDLNVDWLMPEEFSGVIKCTVTPEAVEKKLETSEKKPAAVYITSPDYLGNIQDIKGISAICQNHGVPLLVDNAHGAYLKFLSEDIHPITLGASLCCDSAHKTLPVLTGGAYLHVSKNAPKMFRENARDKISLFSSTSPSYLILQSLDMCNKYLSGSFKKELEECVKETENIKEYIKNKGFNLMESEPLKIVINTNGEKIAKELREKGIEPEFYDRDFLVLMITPQNTKSDFEKLKSAFSSLPICLPCLNGWEPPKVVEGYTKGEEPCSGGGIFIGFPQKLTIREAIFSPSEWVDIDHAKGRICAAPTVSCPPAVPIAISGEEITEEIINLFKYYGIHKIKCTANKTR